MIDNPEVPPECTSVSVQTDLCLISSEGNEIVHDQTQTNDKTHVQHPLFQKVPEQEEVEFERPENFAFLNSGSKRPKRRC